MANREDIMRKVSALLDRANSTTFDAERDECIKKADSLMAAYAIEQFEIDMARPKGERQKPEVRVFDFASDRLGDYEVHKQMVNMFGNLARHCGCLLGVYRYDHAKVVGFASDLDWLTWLYASVRLHMATTMIPQVNAEMSLEQNIVLLKETGLKWQDIWLKILPVFPDHPKVKKYGVEEKEYPYGWDRKANGLLYPRTIPRPFGVWCTGVYTKHCKENDLPRNYANPSVYRRSFIDGYVSRLNERIYEMGNDRRQASTGKELVLANRDEDLRSFLWDEFPDLKPHDPDCDCETHHRCNNKNCKRTNCVNARKPIRYSSARYRDPVMDAGAMRNGAKAANGADLTGGRNRVGGQRGELG